MQRTYAPAGVIPPEPEHIARKLPKRMVQLERMVSVFEADRRYSEFEVNVALMPFVIDHVFARRLLVEWGFLGRETDGSAYWLLRTERPENAPR
ncbi:MAG: hypothetical protein RLZZ514_1094 [Actinomycetota bacterium]|jgi:hypothetical protein